MIEATPNRLLWFLLHSGSGNCYSGRITILRRRILVVALEAKNGFPWEIWQSREALHKSQSTLLSA